MRYGDMPAMSKFMALDMQKQGLIEKRPQEGHKRGVRKAKRKAAQEDLDKRIDAKYPKLTEAEIKTLVVDDKWMARLSAAVQGELDRVSQTLTGRIRELAERYATPLPKLVSPNPYATYAKVDVG